MKTFLNATLLAAILAAGSLSPTSANAQLAFNMSVPIAQPVYYYDPYYPAAYATYFSYYYPTYNWLATPYYAIFSGDALAAATVTSPSYYGYPYALGYPYPYGAFTAPSPYRPTPYDAAFPYVGLGTSTYYALGYPWHYADYYDPYAGYFPTYPYTAFYPRTTYRYYPYDAYPYYYGYYPVGYYGSYFPTSTYYYPSMWAMW